MAAASLPVLTRESARLPGAIPNITENTLYCEMWSFPRYVLIDL